MLDTTFLEALALRLEVVEREVRESREALDNLLYHKGSLAVDIDTERERYNRFCITQQALIDCMAYERARNHNQEVQELDLVTNTIIDYCTRWGVTFSDGLLVGLLNSTEIQQLDE